MGCCGWDRSCVVRRIWYRPSRTAVPISVWFPEGISWSYNTGKTIRQALNDIVIHGSTFVKAGEYYWSYVGKDGKIHITKGMSSRPFMYNTANELMDKIVETAREVFGK